MEYWHWLALGLICLGIEMATPGIWFLWFGLAALATGIVAFILPLPVMVQWVIFSVLAVVFVLVGRRWYNAGGEASDNGLNNRAQALIGRRVRLEEAIQNGHGVVNIDDTRWPASGDDASAGVDVEVVAVNGSRLTVRRVG